MLQRHFRRALLRFHILLISDLAAFALLREFVQAVRDGGALGTTATDVFTSLIPQGLLGGWQFGLAVVVGLLVTGSYGAGDDRRDPARLGSAAALATALPLWSALWTAGAAETLVVYAFVTVLLTVAMVSERLLVDRLLRVVGFPRAHPACAVFVGTHDEFEASSRGPAFSADRDYRVLGYVSTEMPLTNNALGGLADLRRIVLDRHAETVVVCGKLDDEQFRGVVQAAHDGGCELLTVPRRFTATGVEPQLVWRRGQPLIELTSPAVKGPELILKRIVDVLVSAVGLVLLLPLFAIVAVAIKLDSRGPLLFQSPRWGRFGRRIGIWKFRSMRTDAAEILEQDPGLKARFTSNIKIEDDPRITWVGRFLRRWSIDELPQLWNVLAGDLSLVGPRPKLLGEEAKYGAALETVLAVRPGITGLWQVSGRSLTTYDERIALDVKYVTHPSLVEDARILLKTLPAVVRGRGAH